MNKKKILCANCGSSNHMYKNCTHPITSFGIICVRFNNIQGNILPEYLMVQRKDSLSYSTFIRGKYRIETKKYLIELFENMTECERNDIITKDFESLWKDLWKIEECNSFLKEYEDAKFKFEILQKGIRIRNYTFDLNYLINNTKSKFDETEWGFPKGRRNINEGDFQCAMREFVEETSINTQNIRLLFNDPFNEIFLGGNKLKYKYIYYVCQLFDKQYLTEKVILPQNKIQEREVQQAEWFTFNEALGKIRKCNKERIELLTFINSSLMNFSLVALQN